MSSSAVPRAESGSIPDRLSVGALGLALVLLVSAAWGTGLFYIVARLGLPAPVQLAWIDGIHVYVGLVGAVFIVGKLIRVGLRYPVRGVPAVVPWQRWMSWSLLALYSVIFATGVLVLLPVPGRVYADLVELHLLTSVWALIPTTWHVWHYRARATPFVARFLARARGRRFWAGFALALTPAVLVAMQPRGVSQLPQVMGGGNWSQAGLKGIPISQVETTSDGRTLLAAGNKVYLTGDGVTWRSIDFATPQGFIPVPPGSDPHVHSAASAVPTVIQSVAVGDGGVYVGTALGLFSSPASGGPLVDLHYPASNVVAIAVDRTNPRGMWTASAAGVLLSSDGGRTWSTVSTGLARPETVSSITYLGSRLFASDVTGVFEWSAASRSWVRSSNQANVIGLTATPGGQALYAASSNGELHVLAGGAWRVLGRPGTAHLHAGQIHQTLRSVFPYAGRLFAGGTADGVSASADGGQTWTQLGGAVADRAPGEVVAFHGRLVAATSNGLYQYLLVASQPASETWWMILVATSLAVGALALAVLGLERVRPRVGRRLAAAGPVYQRVFERPFHGIENFVINMAGLSPPRTPEPPPPRVVASAPSERFAGVHAFMARRDGEAPSLAVAPPTRPIPEAPSVPAGRFGGVETYMAQLTGQPPSQPAPVPTSRVGVPAEPAQASSPQVWPLIPPVDSAPPEDRTRRLSPPPAVPETRVLRPRKSHTSSR